MEEALGSIKLSSRHIYEVVLNLEGHQIEADAHTQPCGNGGHYYASLQASMQGQAITGQPLQEAMVDCHARLRHNLFLLSISIRVNLEVETCPLSRSLTSQAVEILIRKITAQQVCYRAVQLNSMLVEKSGAELVIYTLLANQKFISQQCLVYMLSPVIVQPRLSKGLIRKITAQVYCCAMSSFNKMPKKKPQGRLSDIYLLAKQKIVPVSGSQSSLGAE